MLLAREIDLRRELRPHQKEAYDGALAVFADHSRANIVMACGSGKTLVGMRAAESGNRILMLEPSLALIRQALEEARMDGLLTDRTVICVCSDNTLACEDHWKVTDEELGVPVTTDSVVLRQMLQQSRERCVVFCTYQSQPLLRDSLPAGFRFDFGYFDEAHRTAGVRERTFSVALSDEQIAISKRLFLTATPRLFEVDDVRNSPAYSMDDTATYGPRAYELDLETAIQRGVVCDYQVLTACVTGTDVQEALKRARGLLLSQNKLPVELVAGQIAIVRALQSTGARRVITFHATIEEAAAFARDRLKLYKQAGVTTFHIHGDMPGRQRQAVINAFLSTQGPAILTNCHCLTEGVDVPDIDMVGIMCRKESVQELVQALGRALRNRPGKELGYVMLPLYVNEDEPMESALNRSAMGITWEILHSMLESDGALTDRLRIARASVTTDSDNSQHRQRGHLRVVGPDALLEDLQRAISVRHIHRLSARWDVMILAAKRFAEREGLLAVPLEHLEDELPLGRWLEKQRYLRKKGRLSAERSKELAEIGMVWDVREVRWAMGLKLARAFKLANGHLRVPASEKFLRNWIHYARIKAQNGQLQDAKRRALNELGIEPPKPRSDGGSLEALERWRETHPEGRPQRRGPDRSLALFIRRTVARYRVGNVEEETLDRLAAIGIDIRNNPRKGLTTYQQLGEKAWDLYYQALRSYVETHNWHDLWRQRIVNGLSVQGWVVYQRELKRKGRLSPERVAALDALGIHWNRKVDWWVKWVEQLETFHREHGHLRLPKTTAYRALQQKVTFFRSRIQKGTAALELAKRLNAISFPHTAEEEHRQWAILGLRRWQEMHGPDALTRPDLPKMLRLFLTKKQRAHRRVPLPEDQLAQFRSLGVPWAAADTLHTQMMARLTRIAREFGKANVESMANREDDLREWLELQLDAAGRGELHPTAQSDLQRVGVDLSERTPANGALDSTVLAKT